MFIKIIPILIIIAIYSQVISARENFTYEVGDRITIPPSSTVSLSNIILTKSGEYLGSGELLVSLQIFQKNPIIAPYNIIYFNMSTSTDLQCYYNWINQKAAPTTIQCIQQINGQNVCANYSQCKNQSVKYQFSLNTDLHHSQNLLLIENSDKGQDITIYTKYSVKLLANNAWFYWGIALTCILLLNIVVFTGVAFYWYLKYKKTKKKFQEYKLTVANDIKNQ